MECDRSGTKRIGSADRKILIYVTAHYELPAADLREAVGTIRKRAKSRCVDEGNNCWRTCKTDIYWISWRGLNDLISQNCSLYTGGEQAYLKDLQEVLKLRNLQPFQTPFKNLAYVGEYVPMLNRDTSAPSQEKGFWSGLIDPGIYAALF